MKKKIRIIAEFGYKWREEIVHRPDGMKTIISTKINKIRRKNEFENSTVKQN